MNGFPDFLVIVGPIPKESWTLDRVDPEGHYVPENIRWASKHVQSQNRTNAVEIELNGSRYVTAMCMGCRRCESGGRM